MSSQVPFVGTTSPFLHGAYLLGEQAIQIAYPKFAEEFRPRENTDVVVGAFYADAVHKFAGQCVSIKIKNNTKWPVVKSVKSQRARSMNPRWVLCLFLFLLLFLLLRLIVFAFAFDCFCFCV